MDGPWAVASIDVQLVALAGLAGPALRALVHRKTFLLGRWRSLRGLGHPSHRQSEAPTSSRSHPARENFDARDEP